MEFRRSFFRLHFLGKPVVASRNVSWFLQLADTKYSSPEPLFLWLDLSFITHFKSPCLSSIWQPDPHRALNQLHSQRHRNSINTLSWNSCGTWVSYATFSKRLSSYVCIFCAILNNLARVIYVKNAKWMAITCITLVLSRSTINNVKITVLLVSLALAARLRKCKRFFFFFFSCVCAKRVSWSQAFLAETVETGNKDRDVSQRHALFCEES